MKLLNNLKFLALILFLGQVRLFLEDILMRNCCACWIRFITCAEMYILLIQKKICSGAIQQQKISQLSLYIRNFLHPTILHPTCTWMNSRLDSLSKYPTYQVGEVQFNTCLLCSTAVAVVCILLFTDLSQYLPDMFSFNHIIEVLVFLIRFYSTCLQ